MKKGRWAMLVCIVLVVAVVLCTAGVKKYKSDRLEQARQIWETETERICEEYGFSVSSVHVNGGESSEVGDYSFSLKVNCWRVPKEYKDIYECIRELECMSIPEVGGRAWKVEVYVGKNLYKLEAGDSYILTRNGDQIYDALYWENLDLKEKLPYEGMRERLINYTKLGYPDEVETISSVGNKYYGKKYYWYEGAVHDLDHLLCIAKVRYYDWTSRRTVPGYVYSVNFYNTDSKNYSYSYQEEEDPYNASDYRSAEDFYDDHYDDFFCFEDAESYYYSHRND